MNIPLIILWSIVVLASLILLTVVSLWAHKVKKDLDVQVEYIKQPCSIDYANAINIESRPCCILGTALTASKYVSEIDMVVNPVDMPYLPVCQGYCPQGVKADGMSCINGEGQSSFDGCILISSPKNCQGLSMPVAYSGTTAYYPNSATDATCLQTAVCFNH